MEITDGRIGSFAADRPPCCDVREIHHVGELRADSQLRRLRMPIDRTVGLAIAVRDEVVLRALLGTAPGFNGRPTSGD